MDATCISDHAQGACCLSPQWISTCRGDLPFILQALNQFGDCFDSSVFTQPPGAVVADTRIFMLKGFKG